MSATQVALLKQFVELCKTNPDLLYQPSMAFYKEYLEGMGATIPPPSSGAEKKPSQKAEAESTSKPSYQYEEQQEEDEPEIPKPELDESGILEDMSEQQPLPMGDMSKEVSDEDLEKANENRDMAMAAFSDGDYAKALEYFTKAIELNPGSAILHAKRANTLLKLSKMTAAIRDCDEAIRINPDSAQGYKFRGRAHRLLGHWIEAHQDLAIACKLDYDDIANEWLKEVEPNAKKLQDYNRAKARRTEEKELHERRERVKKAQEANRKAADEAASSGPMDEGDSDTGGLPFADIFKDDPELVQMLKNDPSLLMKVFEIMQNPAEMMKHMGDPVIRKLITKLSSKMGGMGGGTGGMFSGFDAADITEEPSTAGEAGNTNNPPPPPKKNPEPDLD